MEERGRSEGVGVGLGGGACRAGRCERYVGRKNARTPRVRHESHRTQMNR